MRYPFADILFPPRSSPRLVARICGPKSPGCCWPPSAKGTQSASLAGGSAVPITMLSLASRLDSAV